MIDAQNLEYQAVECGKSVLFSKNRIASGGDVTHASGAAEFEFHRPGVYEVCLRTVMATEGSLKTRLTDGLHPEGKPVDGAGICIANLGYYHQPQRTTGFSTLVQIDEGCPFTEQDPARLTFYCPTTVSAGISLYDTTVNIRRLPGEALDCETMLEDGYTISLKKG